MATFSFTLDTDNVVYNVSVEQSEISVEDNAMDSGDPSFDAEIVESIKKELARGNEYAWCDIVVTASLGMFKGVSSLGAVAAGCEEEFESVVEDHGMRDEALKDLLRAMKQGGGTTTEEKSVVEITETVSEDGTPILFVDSAYCPEDANGPILRIYLNDEPVWSNPEYQGPEKN